jgi:hypothetical protein
MEFDPASTRTGARETKSGSSSLGSSHRNDTERPNGTEYPN